MSNRDENLMSWLGLSKIFNWKCARPLGGFFGAVLIGLALISFGSACIATWLLLMALINGDSETAQSSGYVLIAVFGAPFLAWRTLVAAEQAKLQAKSLFNDKINAATEELAARKQVTTVLGKDDYRSVITEWTDDVVRRAAAIDRLEGLAGEETDEALRIAQLLCIYVKELSIDYPAEEPPEGATPNQLRVWTLGLEVKRRDAERAVQSLTRINTQVRDGGDTKTRVVDLEGANLQGFRLNRLDLQNAGLVRASLQGAGLRDARMQGADLTHAQFQGARLVAADMQGADLSNANMEGTSLNSAQMQSATLNNVHLRGAVLYHAQLQGASFESELQGDVELSQDQINVLFDDAGLELPEGFTRPDWPDLNLDSDEFYKEWAAWKALGPEGYVWADRRKYYDEDGSFSDLGPPPPAEGDWLEREIEKSREE